MHQTSPSKGQLKNEQYKEYLTTKVNPILEKFVVDILLEQPNDVLEFMQKWSDQKGQNSVSTHETKNNLKAHQGEQNAYGEISDEEDDEEDVKDLPPPQQFDFEKISFNKSNRTSVSAEAYGYFNKKSDFIPKVIKKTKEQEERIISRLNQAFMFSALDEKERKIVVDAMEEKKFRPGDTVIKQGEDGDNLYVIDQGQLDCFKTFKKEEGDVHLKVYQPGEAFGELALLYNAPRAATIIAKSDSVLFSLDRDCFNHVVKDSAAKKRENYEALLGKIELLDSMDPYEKSKIADALKPLKFRKGEYVVKQGEQGDSFFFVEDGEAVATLNKNEGQETEEVYHYKSGDYFGELALLRDTPRAANIIAISDLSLVQLDRQSFKRLLGPLQEILKRNFGRYEKFVY